VSSFAHSKIYTQKVNAVAVMVEKSPSFDHWNNFISCQKCSTAIKQYKLCHSISIPMSFDSRNSMLEQEISYLAGAPPKRLPFGCQKWSTNRVLITVHLVLSQTSSLTCSETNCNKFVCDTMIARHWINVEPNGSSQVGIVAVSDGKTIRNNLCISFSTW